MLLTITCIFLGNLFSIFVLSLLSCSVMSNSLWLYGLQHTWILQSIGASASLSVLPVNIQCWFLLGLTGLISLRSKGLSRVFSNTTIQNHQFFWHSAFFLVQLPHWLLEKQAFTIWTFVCFVIRCLGLS